MKEYVYRAFRKTFQLKIQEKKGVRGPLGPSSKSVYEDQQTLKELNSAHRGS